MIAAINKYSKISYETPVWNTECSDQGQSVRSKPKQQVKSKSSMSILDKIRFSKNIDIQNIDISHKLARPSNNLNDDISNHAKSLNVSEKQTIFKDKSSIDGFPKQISYNDKLLQNVSQNSKKTLKQKENITHSPIRSRLMNPTQSWTEKAAPQKSAKKNQLQSSRIPRQPLAQLSVHEQLYLDSKKKEIKKSTQLIIQNEYFKKKHPFKPQIGEVSEFLAEERFEKLKERQKFEKQFQDFDDWRQDRKLTKSAAKSAKTLKKSSLEIQNQKCKNEKQAELKNYTMLRQFFFYLTGSQDNLCFAHFSSKKLCEFPSPMIKFLEPIIQVFYKDKLKCTLNWLQFLSEFNLKVTKRKAFYGLIEKWFFVKFGVAFQGAIMHQKGIESIFRKDQNQTFVGHTALGQQNTKKNVSKKKR